MALGFLRESVSGSCRPIANAARADLPRSAQENVVSAKRVPSGAMSFLGINGRGANASQDVLSGADWLQVIGVNAMANAAEVVKLQAFGNRADAELIRPAVREKPLAAHMFRELPVAGASATGSPEPTRIGELHLRPEANGGSGKSAGALRRNVETPILVPTVVVHSAPTTRPDRTLTFGDSTLFLHRELILSGVMQPDVTSVAAASILTGG